MQSVSSRIWTRVAVSISYDDNHYTTGTSMFEQMIDVKLYCYIYIAILKSFNWVEINLLVLDSNTI